MTLMLAARTAEKTGRMDAAYIAVCRACRGITCLTVDNPAHRVDVARAVYEALLQGDEVRRLSVSVVRKSPRPFCHCETP